MVEVELGTMFCFQLVSLPEQQQMLCAHYSPELREHGTSFFDLLYSQVICCRAPLLSCRSGLCLDLTVEQFREDALSQCSFTILFTFFFISVLSLDWSRQRGLVHYQRHVKEWNIMTLGARPLVVYFDDSCPVNNVIYTWYSIDLDLCRSGNSCTHQQKVVWIEADSLQISSVPINDCRIWQMNYLSII